MKKIDVKKHILVPKHTKLSEKDKQELFKKYNITAEQLPKILKNDAAIAGMGLKPGDVIKVVRESPTAGESIFYRVISNA
ncbi:MAG: DNA-directed RNA polymerase subunit H [bacterium]|nr:DNA-directed RNA polymerase subunit H [bacterium]